MRRVLVCGGRDYFERAVMYAALDAEHARDPFSFVVHGDQWGADAIAGDWARSRQVPSKRYVANWKKYGRPAGPIRNREMLVDGKPDVVVAFPGGDGTDNMVKQAERAKVLVLDKR